MLNESPPMLEYRTPPQQTYVPEIYGLPFLRFFLPFARRVIFSIGLSILCYSIASAISHGTGFQDAEHGAGIGGFLIGMALPISFRKGIFDGPTSPQ
jgi:hypothetical protein